MVVTSCKSHKICKVSNKTPCSIHMYVPLLLVVVVPVIKARMVFYC